MVVSGDTPVEPLTSTLPIPLSMVQVSALLLVQLKVEEASLTMLTGSALKVSVGTGGSLTSIVTSALAVPPGPVAVTE